jgi:hypothetical protein
MASIFQYMRGALMVVLSANTVGERMATESASNKDPMRPVFRGFIGREHTGNWPAKTN